MFTELLTAQRPLFGGAIEFDPRKGTEKGYSHVTLDVPVDQLEDVYDLLIRKGYEPCALTYMHPTVGKGEFVCGRFHGKARFEWLESKESGNPHMKSGVTHHVYGEAA